MNKTIIIAVVALVAVGGGIFLISKSGNKSMTPSTQTESVTPTMAAEGTGTPSGTVENTNAKEITIEGSNFKFSPSSFSVKKGDTVKIVFKNSGGFHDFVIDEFNVKTKQIKDGETDTVQFTADKAGTFKFYCSVGNHRAMGMEGTLTVE